MLQYSNCVLYLVLVRYIFIFSGRAYVIVGFHNMIEIIVFPLTFINNAILSNKTYVT
jgi:hypothetical protein